jgi:hypothetical protein
MDGGGGLQPASIFYPEMESMSTAAARKRRYRRRQRAGLVWHGGPMPEDRLAAALMAAGWLSDVEVLSKQKVDEAVVEIVLQYIRRWDC